MEGQYCVYIITNKYHTTLYTGVTNDLQRRIYEHKAKLAKSFSKKYDLYKLVYYEMTGDVKTAIEREKQIKAGSRRNKIDLIDQMNPEWKDLYTEFV